jgi:hypothetical protein
MMADVDVGEYCRELETYLCRKNDGHLIRISGPAFETVCGWAERGIPLKVAFQGIDRHFERYYAKGPRRRPVRIEFCEADVLDAFDQWRRAVGVVGAPEAPSARQPSLPAHLQRALQKLTTARAMSGDAQVAAAIDAAIDGVEAIRGTPGTLRGEARAVAVERLAGIDRELMARLRAAAGAEGLAALAREAEQELAGFAARMTREAHAQAVDAAIERLLRQRAGLSRIAYDD